MDTTNTPGPERPDSLDALLRFSPRAPGSDSFLDFWLWKQENPLDAPELALPGASEPAASAEAAELAELVRRRVRRTYSGFYLWKSGAITIAEAARQSGLSEAAICRAILDGRLRAARTGSGRVLIRGARA